MTTPPQNPPTDLVDIVHAGPERSSALRTLAAALARLGDDASRAARTSQDVRLHVVSCQAQHLAGDVWSLLTDGGDTDDSFQESDGLVSSVDRARHASQATDVQPLPPALAASLGWLLQLADAVAS